MSKNVWSRALQNIFPFYVVETRIFRGEILASDRKGPCFTALLEPKRDPVLGQMSKVDPCSRAK